jgi:5'-nucleotidase/UDP-sugar diphosphatase
MNAWKRCAVLLLLALTGLASLSAMGGAETFTLTVLATNDTHGHPLAFSWSDSVGGTAWNSPTAGGLPARKTYIDAVKVQEPNTLVLDAGDMTTGLVVSNLFQAKPDVVGMNLAGYQAMSLGNHEFDNSQATLAARKAEATFPFLSANVYVKATGKRAFQPYALIKLSTVTVGVIGVTTEETPIVTLPANVESLDFREPAAEIQSLVKEVRAKSDFVIVLSHLGLEEDRAVAQRLSGVDLIIGGHSHTYMSKEEVVNGIPIFQAYQWGLFVGRTDVVVKSRKVVSVTSKPVPINLSVPYKDGDTAKGTVKEIAGKKYDFVGGYLEADAAVQAALQPFADQVSKDLDTVIGNATGAFPDTVNGLGRYPRRDDSALSNLITDAMREQTSLILGKPVDVFLQNGGGIRATLPAGPVTKRAVFTVLPFDNTIETASITGAKLLEVLEKRALPVAIENYTTGYDGPNGAFLQVSGLTYTLDLTAKTVSDVKVNGQPLDLGKTYLMATQNFMMTGGDGYSMLKGLPGMFETSAFQRDAVMAWIARKGTLNPADYEDNRINLVNTGK